MAPKMATGFLAQRLLEKVSQPLKMNEQVHRVFLLNWPPVKNGKNANFPTQRAGGGTAYGGHFSVAPLGNSSIQLHF